MNIHIKKMFSVIIAMTMILCCFAPAFAADKKVYLSLGDSIAYGQGIANPEEASYGKIVADTIGYEYINQAVSGYNSEALLVYLELPAVKSDIKKADIINLSIGGNDYLTDNMAALAVKAIVLGDYSDFDKIAEDFYENFCKIIAKIKEYNPKAVLIVNNMYNPRFGIGREIYQQAVNRLNDCYERYLDENPKSYAIVDAASAIGNNEAYIAMDTIHPNAQGNVCIAQAALKTLNSLGVTKNTKLVINATGLDYGANGIDGIVYNVRIFLEELAADILAFAGFSV